MFSTPTAVTTLSARTLCVIVAFSAIGLTGCHKKSHAHNVTLTWQKPKSTPEATIVGYNVYRRANSNTPYVRIATQVVGQSYEDRLVSSGTSYYYAVTAVDQRGHESRFSTVIKVDVP
jgi:fibronectin type 3 domain-containing protein